jgi:hypothetical protein
VTVQLTFWSSVDPASVHSFGASVNGSSMVYVADTSSLTAVSLGTPSAETENALAVPAVASSATTQRSTAVLLEQRIKFIFVVFDQVL